GLNGSDSKVRLSVYNSLGKEIAELVNENLGAGSYETEFDASDFSSGVYFYKIETDNFSLTKSMFLIK
ncbi:MAG: T9SS type A sorting domain-containing protein, partial [Ignavibacteria bacterium]